MKLLFWNSYHGFTKSSPDMEPPLQRRIQFVHWIKQQQPDIVALVEMKGFDADSLGAIASHWGHSNHVLNSGEFPIALTCSDFIRYPICHNDKMVNGFLSAHAGALPVFITHIPPAQFCDRSEELRQLLPHLLTGLNQGADFIVMADLNGAEDDPLVVALKAVGLRLLNTDEGVDYVFASEGMVGRASKVERPESPELARLSDHYPLIVEIT
jgi:exodeoxyribonuclease III